MSNWKDRLRRFMIGRYGMDQMNRCLMYGILIL